MNKHISDILHLYCDGGARGNPGPSGIGVFAQDSNGKALFRVSKPIGYHTNNEAEYLAVIESLKILSKNNMYSEEFEKVVVYLDSKLVASQLNGIYKVRNARLRQHLLEARVLESQVGLPIAYKVIPREKNRKADQLVNMALDSGEEHVSFGASRQP